MKSKQVPFFLYWRVEYVQFFINSIGHLGWLSYISNFPRFHKNVNSLKLWKYISENSSPKGSFWRNKRRSEFSQLSWDKFSIFTGINVLEFFFKSVIESSFDKESTFQSRSVLLQVLAYQIQAKKGKLKFKKKNITRQIYSRFDFLS